jgi:hypothetical protein
VPSLAGSLAAENPYESIHMHLFTLPDSCIVYAPQDYNSLMDNTIGDEKANNPRLGSTNTKGKFAESTTNLNLAYPKKIDIATVPANMCCGAICNFLRREDELMTELLNQKQSTSY